MKEKVLATSVISKWLKTVFAILIALTIISSLISLISGISTGIELRKYWIENGFYDRPYSYDCKFCSFSTKKWAEIGNHIKNDHTEGIFYYASPYFIAHWISLFNAGILYLIYFLIKRNKIIITDKNIYGQTALGTKVALPVHMVSSYFTSWILSAVGVGTPSRRFILLCVGNREEIFSVLQELINGRQERTENQQGTESKQSEVKQQTEPQSNDFNATDI